MNNVINILQRTLITHFYKTNAGFFLAAFFFLFGVIAQGQVIMYHLSLIHGIIESQVFTAIVIVIWFLYTLKCVDYIIKQLNEPRQLFLFCLNNVPEKKQYIYMLYVHVLVYMPVLLYAIIVAVIAAKEHRYICMIEVIVSNSIMIAIAAYAYFAALQKRKTIVSSLHWPFKKKYYPKPLPVIPLLHLWHNKKQMLLVTKTFSLLLLYGFIALYEPERYDIRPLLLIVMVISTAHCSIVFQTRLFEDEYLLFSRALPLSIIKRFLFLIAMYGLLLLPELLFVWKAFPLHFSAADYSQLLVLAIAIPVLLHAVLLTGDIDADSYVRIVFGIAAVLFFVLLYNPGILLAIFIMGISFVLFHSHFYTFEKRHT